MSFDEPDADRRLGRLLLNHPMDAAARMVGLPEDELRAWWIGPLGDENPIVLLNDTSFTLDGELVDLATWRLWRDLACDGKSVHDRNGIMVTLEGYNRQLQKSGGTIDDRSLGFLRRFWTKAKAKRGWT